MRILTWIKGLALLRHDELIRDLGERRFHLHAVAQVRSLGIGCRIDNDIRLIGFQLERLSLEESVTVSAGTVLAFGDALNGFARIAIGRNTWIGEYNNLRSGGGDIEIGRNCLISQFCTLVGSNHSTKREQPIIEQPPPAKRRGIVLGDDVWLGAGVTITPGVKIGSGAVIGAGSVVTKDVPEYEIWAGVPAKKIRER